MNLFGLCSVALFLTVAIAAAPAHARSIEVTATDPPTGEPIALGQPLFVRLRYTSDVPLRFQARGMRDGQEYVRGARMNPAPVYPAGTGDALVWLEFPEAVTLDALGIKVFDQRWRPLDTLVHPVRFEWRTGLARDRSDRADWVTSLNAAQQQSTARTPSQDSGGGSLWSLIFRAAGWSIPGYFVAQVWLGRRWRGRWRTAALLPLVATIPILIYTLLALARGSNLWPLVMLFTLPFAFLYLVGLVIAKRVLSPRAVET